MKKQLITLIAMLLPMLASAFSGEIVLNGIKYEISTKEESATIIGPENTDISGDIVIPGSIDYEGKTCYVKTIKSRAFESCKKITSLKIEEGLYGIEYNAFLDCENLSTIYFPSSLTSIGRYAFGGTAWYNNQADGVVYINTPTNIFVYEYKGSMPNDFVLQLNEGTTIICNNVFENLSNLKKIVFPSTLKHIGSFSFEKTSLEELIIPDGVTIDYAAFHNCSNLKKVDLGEVAFIAPGKSSGVSGNWFRLCDNIESVKINCKIISHGLFSGIKSLKNVSLGNKVEKIEVSAFGGCTGIQEIAFPESLKYLGGFSGCTGLTTLTIPSNVESIEYSAFKDCSGLISVSFSSGLKRINGYAFEGCTGLSTIEIPNTVDSIGYDFNNNNHGRSFAGCTNLKNVILPDEIRAIAGGTFLNCTSLRKCNLPSQLKEIRAQLFRNCSNLEMVTIPANVMTIYGSAFSNCPELSDVICYASQVPSEGNTDGSGYSSNPFEDSKIGYATLYVPSQAIESYKKANYWNQFGKIVAISDYEAPKCATPQIKYENGKLSFSCDTEGATFISEITDSDVRISDKNVIDLTATYNINVYAKAPDYINSDMATATLCWIDVDPKTEGIDNGVAQVRANAVLIQSRGNMLNITGAPDGSVISVYNLAGEKVGSAKVTSESADVSTSLQFGDVGIVKIGEKSIKVLMK